MAFKITDALAGNATAVALRLDGEQHWFIEIVSSVGNDRWIAWGLAAFAIIISIIQRRLALKKTAQLSELIRGYEERLDPNRSSSGLTPSGESPANR